MVYGCPDGVHSSIPNQDATTGANQILSNPFQFNFGGFRQTTDTSNDDYNIGKRNTSASVTLDLPTLNLADGTTVDVDFVKSLHEFKSFEDVYENIPYTDEITGISYVNKAVFECNKHEDAIGQQWSAVTNGEDTLGPKSSFKEMLNAMGCFMFLPPENVSAAECEPKSFNFEQTSSLAQKPEDLDDEFSRRCREMPISYVLDYEKAIVYDNPYCAMLNLGVNKTVFSHDQINRPKLYKQLEECKVRYQLLPFSMVMSFQNGKVLVALMNQHAAPLTDEQSSMINWQKIQCGGNLEKQLSNDAKRNDFECIPQCKPGLVYRDFRCMRKVLVRIAIPIEEIIIRPSHENKLTIQFYWQCMLEQMLHEIQSADVKLDQVEIKAQLGQEENLLVSTLDMFYLKEHYMNYLFLDDNTRGDFLAFVSAVKLFDYKRRHTVVVSKETQHSRTKTPLETDVILPEINRGVDVTFCYSIKTTFDEEVNGSNGEKWSCYKEKFKSPPGHVYKGIDTCIEKSILNAMAVKASSLQHDYLNSGRTCTARKFVHIILTLGFKITLMLMNNV